MRCHETVNLIAIGRRNLARSFYKLLEFLMATNSFKSTVSTHKRVAVSVAAVPAPVKLIPSAIEVQGTIGIRKCAEYFQRHGDAPPPQR